MIATPNHLHSLVSILAAQNGKHVYVEKPVSHNIWEGRKLVEASVKYGKKGVIIQHGMQRRSDSGWREVMEWIKASRRNAREPRLLLQAQKEHRQSAGT